MEIQKCLPLLYYAKGYKFFLPLLLVFFVVSTKSQILLIDLSIGLPPNNELVTFVSPPVATCPGPTITTPPTNQTTCNNTTASFSVIASGVGTLSYQWQENQGSGFNNISGANNASYIINAVSASQNNYTYQVIITDDNGTTGDLTDDCMTTSPIVTLTVFSLTCESAPWGGNN